MCALIALTWWMPFSSSLMMGLLVVPGIYLSTEISWSQDAFGGAWIARIDPLALVSIAVRAGCARGRHLRHLEHGCRGWRGSARIAPSGATMPRATSPDER